MASSAFFIHFHDLCDEPFSHGNDCYIEWQKSLPSVINDVRRTHFNVLWDGAVLDGKTTAIFKSYA